MQYFSQYEFELAISKILEHGDIETIASKVGKGAGLVGQYFDPNNERQSNLYRAAETLTAMIEIDETNGRMALEQFCHFVQRALRGKESLCVDRTRERAFREDCEFKLAAAVGSVDTQIKELEDNITAAVDHLEALRAERKREIQAEVFSKATERLNSNRTVQQIRRAK